MNSKTKNKIKNFLKKNWKWLVGTGTFLIAGTIALLVGFEMSGWSLAKWLQSNHAITFFVILGAGILGLALVVYYYIRSKFGGDR